MVFGRRDAIRGTIQLGHPGADSAHGNECHMSTGVSVCSDGVRTADEGCDDGNTASLDGTMSARVFYLCVCVCMFYLSGTASGTACCACV